MPEGRRCAYFVVACGGILILASDYVDEKTSVHRRGLLCSTSILRQTDQHPAEFLRKSIGRGGDQAREQPLHLAQFLFTFA